MNSGTRKLMSLWRPNDDPKRKESNRKEKEPTVHDRPSTTSHNHQPKPHQKQEILVKRNKLLGSKSLLNLIPENLTIRGFGDTRKKSGGCNRSKTHGYVRDTKDSKINDRLGTTKSFPLALCQFQVQSHRFHISGISSISPIVHLNHAQSSKPKSNMPSSDQPISSSIAHDFVNESFDFGDAHQQKLPLEMSNEGGADMSWVEVGSPVEISNENKSREKDTTGGTNNDHSSSSGGSNSNKIGASKKQRRAAKTVSVLRDVKNSLSLRIKAKHENKAFSKFTNQADTPSTKLYSPFNIYTEEYQEDCQDMSFESQDSGSMHQPSSKDRKSAVESNGIENGDSSGHRSKVRQRLALFGKRGIQLREESEVLNYDSPNKRLRAMVKDVEQSQRCIEDISRTIEGRKMLMH